MIRAIPMDRLPEATNRLALPMLTLLPLGLSMNCRGGIQDPKHLTMDSHNLVGSKTVVSPELTLIPKRTTIPLKDRQCLRQVEDNRTHNHPGWNSLLTHSHQPVKPMEPENHTAQGMMAAVVDVTGSDWIIITQGRCPGDTPSARVVFQSNDAFKAETIEFDTARLSCTTTNLATVVICSGLIPFLFRLLALTVFSDTTLNLKWRCEDGFPTRQASPHF